MAKKTFPEILRYFLEDLLQDEFWYHTKSMFSWWWIYKFEKIFALLIDDEFYFKTWENNIQDYINLFSSPFRYSVKWKIRQLPYYKLPEEILENSDELKNWIQKSLDVPEKIKVQKKSPDISKKVLNYLQDIPVWKVSTYKILADKFKVHPRTIASIMKYNKEPYIFPCYKVISHDWKLSWYNTPRGIEEKIEKLKNDGIEIKNGKIDKKYFYNE